MGRAIGDYAMIEAGDRILVAVSGGTDSLVLLWMLHQRQRWSPVSYSLVPVHIDPGFPGDRGQGAAAFCQGLGLTLKVVHTDDGIRAHGPENLENPCFFCSRRRRRRLFEIAAADGCGKMALGHNQDDIIETFFINVCYAGEISTMVPAQPLFDHRFTVIRPLAYAPAAAVRRLAREIGMPRIANPCPSAENSRRRQVRDLLAGLYRTNRKIRGNVFNALRNVKKEYLLKP
ncbi:MAG: ATP-binding protein [Desulfobacterales bacterium]|jgi:tRNA 2-thiocytidine biosynthesis protein TtcA|nr:ATP-binding protein [Desulfobacteraceae bacterium]MDD3991527.1 ATP-binding protein [Desulfobacteraceae bacterium]MDY0312182.1 ATP-binding protein [Desulfobacterales bacterium]